MSPAPTPAPSLPEDLIIEIISRLSIKILLRFRCINKYFKTLISNPLFIQIHLKKSSQNPHLAVITTHSSKKLDSHFVSFPITILHYNPYYRLDDNGRKKWIVGSCNGLLCLIDNLQHLYSSPKHYDWVYFWNPATRAESTRILVHMDSSFKLSFGYDNFSDTYKVVAFHMDVERGNVRSEVKVFSLENNYGRNIQGFPVLPLYWFCSDKNEGVYLNGTINWLAIRNYYHPHYNNLDGRISVEQYVIVSLDLSTESYTQMLLPQGFDEVPRRVQPTLVVLMDCLCFSHYLKGTHFVIWLMKDFGIQESWTQLFKISYKNFNSSICGCSLKFQNLKLLPLYHSENGDTLVLAINEKDPAFIYNCKDNTVERIKIIDKMWWLWAKDYVESLAPTR